MKKIFKSLKWLLPMSMIGVGVIASPILVVSCSNTSTNPTKEMTNKILDVNKKFANDEGKYLIAADYQLPKWNQQEPEKVFKDLYTNAEQAVNELKQLKSDNMTLDQTIWLDSFIFKWENKKNNLKSGMIFLGANPISGSRVLSSSENHIRKAVNDAINIYPINEETGDPNKDAEPLKELVLKLPTTINSAKETIDTLKSYLEYGADTYGVMPSTIAKKYLINQLLTTFYSKQIDQFAKSNDNEIEIQKLVNLKLADGDYFDENLVNKLKQLSYANMDEINKSLDGLRQSLNDFMIYYCTTYYNHQSSFGPAANADLKLTKTKDRNAKEKVINAVDDIKIYGPHITEQDLTTKNVGIGFMNLKKVPNSFFTFQSANDIYQQMLFNNNSINTSASEIYKKGVDLSKQFKNNMSVIATESEKIITNGFNDQIWYDEDGIGIEAPKLITLEGEAFNKFNKFNKWLNQEDFFWGREKLEPEQLKTYIDNYWKNPSSELIKGYKKIIINQGYETPWSGKTTINGQSTGTVSGDQALAGAVASLHDYIQFKKVTDPTFDPMFNKIKDYVISPYNYNIREDIGVGMEGPRGSCQFQYNCDPYYSLPKWSVSSLTVHEGKMGHHTQQEYWTEYLVGKDGLTHEGPGYIFVNDAFHEGWAVFTEWYANELGIYGSELDETTSMPTDWLHAKGLVPNYDEANVEKLTAEMKSIHNGVYYQKANGTDNSPEKLKNSIKLANMLQYYGFLNEAQLRNMRLCLDTAYHHNGTGQDASIIDQSLPFGASINDVRNYMTNNSALSIGDITSESVRYLVQPSQATGYMLGKIIFEDLYRAVEKKLQVKLSLSPEESKKLFDLMLRNGEIPLEVLQAQVIKEYNITNKFSSYQWLEKITKEVPNRKAGNDYNTVELASQNKGERNASTWIKDQLKEMGYAENTTKNPARELPSNPTYNNNGIAVNVLATKQKEEDMKFEGYYENLYYWKNRELTDQASQNIVLNINSTKNNAPAPNDFYIVSHYDTANINNDGTNDNSSGMALNLALAGYFSDIKNRSNLNVNLHLLFAGAEEVGVKGTWAWTTQYLDEPTKASIKGMLNLDSVAGGDYLYVHSPDSQNAELDWNTSNTIRNEINKQSPELLLHPQFEGASFSKGETGDWSDHAPFYKNGIPVAYIEATNFNIRGKDGYDGYSQTINPEYWLKDNGEKVNLIEKQIQDLEGNQITVYEPENYDALKKDESFHSWGKLWHMDCDIFAQYEKNFPGRLLQQMTTVYNAVIKYIMSIPSA